MIKTELKARWGEYCDTDQMVDKMIALLEKYHHDCTEHGVCEILNTYFENKKPLIDMLVKSDSYVGDMRICIDVEMERNINRNEVKDFCQNFPGKVDAHTVFYKYADEHGKTLKDYTRVGVCRFKAKQLCYGNLSDLLSANAENRKKFNVDGVTIASYREYEKFYRMLQGFKHSTSVGLQPDTVNALLQYEVNGRFAVGMKTSRAFNRVCSIYGVDKLPNYNKLFAEYADMVSGLKRKLKFYISVNPLDYLTMSFGNSWSSCHTIDKKNERGMQNGYQGMHCGGVLSYMLDGTSIITYVHTRATKDHEEGKLYRNMFHFADGALVQGRVYPQGNDGATDLYREFRRFVQIELTKLLGLREDAWIRKSGGYGSNICTTGVHYPDYHHFDGCNMSYPREMPDAYNVLIKVGHSRICPICGKVVSDDEDSAWLSHENCDNANDDYDDDAWD